MVKRFLLTVVLSLIASLAQANSLVAEVNREEIGLGEQVELTLVLTGIRGNRPDTSALLDDFSIDRQAQSSNMQIINGVVKQSISWTFLLSPNRKGNLTIPSLNVGSYRSDAIKITVTDMPEAQSTSDDVLLEVEITPSKPYLREQVAYIQRLYYSRPLVDNASITNPKIAKGDADIQFWGSSDPRYVTHNNRPYQLIERYYIVYPRKSGELAFEPSVFNGSLASSRRNDFQMNMFRSGTRVNAYSPRVSVDVQGIPAGFDADNWLPASQVTLNINFSQPVASLTAGDPLTVTIAVMAEGLKAEVLPEIKLNLPDAIKAYPEKPRFQTDKASNGMVGLRQEKVVLIANTAGEYEIPEVVIPWWDVKQGKRMEAKLERFVLKVAPGAAGATESKPPAENLPNMDAQTSEAIAAGQLTLPENSDEKGAESKVESALGLVKNPVNHLMGSMIKHKEAVAVGTLIVTVIGLLLLVAWRKRKAYVSSESYLAKQDEKVLISQLKVACNNNDIPAVLELLPKWADCVGIQPATLAGIQSCGDSKLSEAIRALADSAFSPSPKAWLGKDLLSAIRQYDVSTTKHQTIGLKPLHPV